MAPILVQEVAHIEDIEGQLDGIDLTSHLEVEFLTEMNIEMMLESQVDIKLLSFQGDLLSHAEFTTIYLMLNSQPQYSWL